MAFGLPYDQVSALCFFVLVCWLVGGERLGVGALRGGGEGPDESGPEPPLYILLVGEACSESVPNSAR